MTDLAAVLLIWVPIGLMAYNWVLFPALLMIAVRLKRAKPVAVRAGDLPRVSVVIAAWNEELCIAEKINHLGDKVSDIEDLLRAALPRTQASMSRLRAWLFSATCSPGAHVGVRTILEN